MNPVLDESDPLVLHHKQLYESRLRAKCSLGYLHILRLLRLDLSLAAIARIGDVTTEAMSLIYEGYFQKVCGGESPLERHQRIAGRAPRGNEPILTRIPPAIAEAARRARAAGVEAELYIRIGKDGLPSIDQWTIGLNGNPWRVHYLTTCRPTVSRCDRNYASTDLRKSTLTSTLGHLFMLGVEGHEDDYLIRSKTLRRKVLNNGKDSCSFYIPVPLSTSLKGGARIDLSNYRNRWDLVPARVESS